jgi:hypothetical protein
MPGFPIVRIELRPLMGAGTRIEQGSRSQSERRDQAIQRKHVPRLFHIYVMPRGRDKRIPGLGLPV